METWSSDAPFRETLRKHAGDVGAALDEARLDDVCRPERYVDRLGDVFDRVARLQ
jgi:adenylosuccinate lyase